MFDGLTLAGWTDEYDNKFAAFADYYPTVERNSTTTRRFSMTERWRAEVTAEFVFTMRAWQRITHEWSSPTWNSHRDAIPDDETDAVGSMDPNEVGYCLFNEAQFENGAAQIDRLV